MNFLKRISLFLAVNLLIVLTISIVLNVLGIRPYLTARGIDYQSLMVFCLIWGMAGSFISLGMSRMMAKWSLGVQLIDPDTRNGGEQELLQMVYRLARSAGLGTMPQVGIYPSAEVNAFATGPTRNRALVAVSAGILQAMDRSELEAVLGHEISHVANGDMVTMTLLQGIINAFVMFLARIIAFAISQSGSRDDERRSSYGMNYLLVMVLEMVLGLLGMVVVMAFSRWRELRADRGGAQLAGTGKMIDALKALQRSMNRIEPARGSFANLKIAAPQGFARIFMSHPPLDERIARLEQLR